MEKEIVFPRNPNADCKLVLLIVTGGTMTMHRTEDINEPIRGFIGEDIHNTTSLHDNEDFKRYIQESKHTEQEAESLFMLPRFQKSEKRVVYSMYEFPVLLNSCHVDIKEYIEIAETIAYAYDHFDGFVIIHGTDTMAYTTSYLSFMLQNLRKSVIFTGSQIPLRGSRSDAIDNLQESIFLAGNYVISEVTLLFNNVLYRGNRVTKLDSDDFRAYGSLNCDPIAHLGIKVNIDWDNVRQHPTNEKFSVSLFLDPNVAVLRFFPGITVETVEKFLQPPARGIVIQSYGAGNGPSNRSDIMAVIKKATDSGVLILNCTQCLIGTVVDVYETGRAFYNAGVLPGYDLTVEAALAKLSFVLGSKSLTTYQKKSLLSTNLKGEMTIPDIQIEMISDKLIEAVGNSINKSLKDEQKNLKLALIPSLVYSAAKERSLEKLAMLSEAGNDILHVRNYDGKTALHIAISEGNTTAVEFLLEQGSPVDIEDRYSNTPMLNAIQLKQFECIKLLISAGATLGLSDDEIGAHLCFLTHERDLQAIKCWEAAGAKLDMTRKDGKTALDIAKCNKYAEIVEYIRRSS